MAAEFKSKYEDMKFATRILHVGNVRAPRLEVPMAALKRGGESSSSVPANGWLAASQRRGVACAASPPVNWLGRGVYWVFMIGETFWGCGWGRGRCSYGWGAGGWLAGFFSLTAACSVRRCYLQEPDAISGAVAVPISLASTFAQKSPGVPSVRCAGGCLLVLAVCAGCVGRTAF